MTPVTSILNLRSRMRSFTASEKKTLFSYVASPMKTSGQWQGMTTRSKWSAGASSATLAPIWRMSFSMSFGVTL